jgi:hypothetical protein
LRGTGHRPAPRAKAAGSKPRSTINLTQGDQIGTTASVSRRPLLILPGTVPWPHSCQRESPDEP